MANEQSMSERRDADFAAALSAFLDGEIDRSTARFVIRRLENDREARAKLERMSLIGACLRGEFAARSRPSLPDRVAAALASEDLARRRRFGGQWRWPVGLSAAVAVTALTLLAGGPATMEPSPTAGLAVTQAALSGGLRPERPQPIAAPAPFADVRTVRWTLSESRPQSGWPLVAEPPPYLRLLGSGSPALAPGQVAVPVALSRPRPPESPVEPAPRR